jgi:hypothetical protein
MIPIRLRLSKCFHTSQGRGSQDFSNQQWRALAYINCHRAGMPSLTRTTVIARGRGPGVRAGWPKSRVIRPYSDFKGRQGEKRGGPAGKTHHRPRMALIPNAPKRTPHLGRSVAPQAGRLSICRRSRSVNNTIVPPFEIVKSIDCLAIGRHINDLTLAPLGRPAVAQPLVASINIRRHMLADDFTMFFPDSGILIIDCPYFQFVIIITYCTMKQ